MAKKDKKEQTSFSGKKGYDMLRDMIGPGTFKKPKQESLLPKFFKFVPDPYTATDKIMDKIKKKTKKKAGGGLTKTVAPKRGPNPHSSKNKKTLKAKKKKDLIDEMQPDRIFTPGVKGPLRKVSSGGMMVKGQGAAVRGTKFSGIY